MNFKILRSNEFTSAKKWGWMSWLASDFDPGPSKPQPLPLPLWLHRCRSRNWADSCCVYSSYPAVGDYDSEPVPGRSETTPRPGPLPTVNNWRLRQRPWHPTLLATPAPRPGNRRLRGVASWSCCREWGGNWVLVCCGRWPWWRRGRLDCTHWSTCRWVYTWNMC